jgi:hypothetical protein
MNILEQIAQRSTGHLVVLFGAGLTLCASAALAGAIMWKDPVLSDSERTSDLPQIVVAEADDCDACISFRRDAGRLYQTTTQAEKMPMVFVPLDGRAIKSFKLKVPVTGTPTLLVIDRFGREVGRSVGNPGDVAFVQKLADGYMRRASK